MMGSKIGDKEEKEAGQEGVEHEIVDDATAAPSCQKDTVRRSQAQYA
jgi:hypothetical protein